MQDDRVVVLGGTGFIGKQLVSQLAGKVQSLRVVSRRGSPASRLPGVVYTQADVEDPAAMIGALEGASVVFHLTIENDFDLAAHNVAKACLAHQVRRLVFASSSDALYLGSVIPNGQGPTLDSRPHKRNPYARGKISAERIMLHYHSSHQLPVVILRPALVVGTGGKLTHGGLGKWKGPTALYGWGNGNNPLPFVLVEDVATAMILAMDTSCIEGKSYDLAGDVFISARDWVGFLRQRARRDFRFFARNLIAMQSRVACKALVKKALGRPLEYHYYRDMRSSAMLTKIVNEPAKRELGWCPNTDLQSLLQGGIDVHVPEIDVNDLRLKRDFAGYLL